MQSKNPFSFCTSLRLFFFKTRSSPHMRGILVHDRADRMGRGIIPAHAGHTQPRKSPAPSHRDHPRTCGAYLRECVEASGNSGSSPHMRGILSCRLSSLMSSGIIPAHAGHTYSLAVLISALWDHPRTCGAYDQTSGVARQWEGSSPHMRGILHLCQGIPNPNGIIPAHAGHTCFSWTHQYG